MRALLFNSSASRYLGPTALLSAALIASATFCTVGFSKGADFTGRCLSPSTMVHRSYTVFALSSVWKTRTQRSQLHVPQQCAVFLPSLRSGLLLPLQQMCVDPNLIYPVQEPFHLTDILVDISASPAAFPVTASACYPWYPFIVFYLRPTPFPRRVILSFRLLHVSVPPSRGASFVSMAGRFPNTVRAGF